MIDIDPDTRTRRNGDTASLGSERSAGYDVVVIPAKQGLVGAGHRGDRRCHMQSRCRSYAEVPTVEPESDAGLSTVLGETKGRADATTAGDAEHERDGSSDLGRFEDVRAVS